METRVQIDYTTDDDGFPDVGYLIRKHRTQLKMSQHELANALGISRTMVTRMEKENRGLDSIVTRRQLSKILGITPVLLGLSSLDDLKQQPLYDTTILRRCYELHRENYFNSGTAGLASTEEMIQHIHTLSKDVNHKNKELLEILCLFGIHGIDVAREGLNTKAITKYIDWSLMIAKTLKDPTLTARVLVSASGAMYDTKNYNKAKEYADEALTYKNIPSHLYGAALLDAGRADSKMNLDMGLKHIEKALTIAANKKESDSTSVKLSTDFCQLRLVYVFLDNGEYGEANDLLDDLDEHIPATMLRRRCMLPTLQARALVAQNDLSAATSCATQAVTLAKMINSKPNMKAINIVYDQLKNSSFGSSREVAHLGRSLL